jgi:phosphocarrier protein
MSGSPDDAPARPDLAAPEPEPEPADSGSALLTQTVTIVNKRGLHARAAAKLVTLAERFSASVEVGRDDQFVSARSIMGLMMLGAGIGSSVELTAEGWDANEALAAIVALVEAGFNETD